MKYQIKTLISQWSSGPFNKIYIIKELPKAYIIYMYICIM